MSFNITAVGSGYIGLVNRQSHQLDGCSYSNLPSYIGLQALCNRSFGGVFVLSLCPLEISVDIGFCRRSESDPFPFILLFINEIKTNCSLLSFLQPFVECRYTFPAIALQHFLCRYRLRNHRKQSKHQQRQKVRAWFWFITCNDTCTCIYFQNIRKY